MLLTKEIIWASCGAFLLLSVQLVLMLKDECGAQATLAWRSIFGRILFLLIPAFGAMLLADRLLFPINETRVRVSLWIFVACVFALTALVGAIDVVSAQIRTASGVDLREKYCGLLMFLLAPLVLVFVVAHIFFWG